jgi:hypothetical protein
LRALALLMDRLRAAAQRQRDVVAAAAAQWTTVKRSTTGLERPPALLAVSTAL